MRFIIRGGKKLSGEITLAGAKNAATKLMVASLLTDEPCYLDNFPEIGDTEITTDILQAIGTTIVRDGSSVMLQTERIKNSAIAIAQNRRNRISILALGPLLARAGEAAVPVVGGDKIGARPVDMHIAALTALGADIKVTADGYEARAKNGLHGTTIVFDFPSVGATENALLAAVLAKGNTVLKNAALEPEVMSLVKMLQKMGAIIELGAHRDFYIEGVPRLRGARQRVLPDRNEAVSFACLAIATGGRILVRDAVQDHLITFLNAVRRIGAYYEVVKEGIIFWREGALRPINIETAVHPGFMTDWQQPFAVLLTQIEGTSTIHETIYENRFGYTADLSAMGANIHIHTDCPTVTAPCRFAHANALHVAEVTGATPLQSTSMSVRDLRAGMVSISAALVAKGTSEISGVEEIDRGYEKIDERLRRLGADVERTA